MTNPNKPIREQYQLLIDETGKDKRWYVMIMDGLYSGLIYHYIKFQIAKEDNEDGTRHYRFEHEVIRVPKHLDGVALPENERSNLANLIGAILLDILENYFEQKEQDTIDMVGMFEKEDAGE